MTDGPSARDALVATWQHDVSSGQLPLVVASDDAVVGSLRALVREAGGSSGDVVEARRLAGRLQRWRAESDGRGRLVVLGALPSGVGSVAPGECVHVAILSPRCEAVERLGRAAEIARPRYLVSELGPARWRGPDRSAWRAGATVVEAFRRRWSIEDREHPVGERGTLRSLGLRATGDAAETRLKLRRVVQSLEALTPSVGRTREGPGRSR